MSEEAKETAKLLSQLCLINKQLGCIVQILMIPIFIVLLGLVLFIALGVHGGRM